MSIMAKARPLEHNARHKLETFKGIVSKAEHRIERAHRVGSHLLQPTRNVKRRDAKTGARLKTMESPGNSAAKEKQIRLLLNTKR